MSARRLRNGVRGFGRPDRSGVEWWLLENGTVTPKASAGVSRDTSPLIPHGDVTNEFSLGATVHSCRNGAVTRSGSSS